MKGALPDNAKIAKEAKECMQECVSEFISFITSEGKSTATQRISTFVSDHKLTYYSFGKMPAREAQNCQR
jgi:histone H3/H4